MPLSWSLRSIQLRVVLTTSRKIATILVSFSLLLVGVVSPASAAPGDGITLYLSAPLVQGSDVTGAGSLTDDFNSVSYGATSSGVQCPANTLVGTLTTTASGTAACILKTVQTYGGASSTSSTPQAGGSGSNFPATPYPANGNKITISFPNPVKYVGFWWSAGNAGNTVEFLDENSNVLASLDTQALVDLLGATPPASWPSGNGSVTALGGDTYPKGHYFGNPRGYSAAPPTSPSSIEANFLHLYLNLYLTGSVTASKIRFGGDGFEFDNITTSVNQQTAANSMVFVRSVLGKSVQFLPGADDATGSMSAQTETTTANLTLNSFQRPGYVFTGWNTRQDGQGTPYADGVSYPFTADMTVYAQWALVPPSSGGGATVRSTPAALATTGTNENFNLAVSLLALGLGLLLHVASRIGLRRNTEEQTI